MSNKDIINMEDNHNASMEGITEGDTSNKKKEDKATDSTHTPVGTPDNILASSQKNFKTLNPMDAIKNASSSEEIGSILLKMSNE